MRRFLFVLAAAAASVAALDLLLACSSTAASDASLMQEEAGARRDGGLVQPPEAGAYDSGASEGPEPSCSAYCVLVTAGCKDDQQQYASLTDCLQLCARLPAGDAGDTETNTVACRQYYAGGPVKTDAPAYCPVAGPFGGGVCGDRCTAFCGLALSACPASSSSAPYASYPDCQTACANYPYKNTLADGGVDSGAPQSLGPASGDTLNCRLFHMQRAILDGAECANLGADSGACR
jgi:hypothetical protein